MIEWQETMSYKNLFFDLDDTLWAFSENSRDAFQETYELHRFDRYFDSFSHYYKLYEERNMLLWDEYAEGKISRDELNEYRFSHPLKSVGVDDPDLCRRFSDDYFAIVPYKEKLMPHAKEVLDYLYPRYNLYIISNGFRELQSRKMKSSGIDAYFQRIILSEDIGIMKPAPEIFHFALTTTGSALNDSMMIGDNPKADIAGAAGVGMDQVYYKIAGNTEAVSPATHVIESLNELKAIL